MATARASLLPADRFVTRHIGPSADETRAMLQALGAASLDEFIDTVVPEDIRLRRDRKSTRLNSSHVSNSYAVFCLKKNTKAPTSNSRTSSPVRSSLSAS